MLTIPLRNDFEAERVRVVAARSDDGKQARRLLSMAAIYDGMDRACAARIGGMDRQTLRDWVHRFNAEGSDKPRGAPHRLTPSQMAALSRAVEAGPEWDGVVRCIDLKQLIRTRFAVDYHERSVGKLPAALGFSHISARPRHVGQEARAQEEFKKSFPEHLANIVAATGHAHPGFKMKCASAKRTAWCASEPQRDRARSRTYGPLRRISSAPSAPSAVRARRWSRL